MTKEEKIEKIKQLINDKNSAYGSFDWLYNRCSEDLNPDRTDWEELYDYTTGLYWLLGDVLRVAMEK